MNSKGGGLAVSLVLVLSGCTGADGLPGSQQVGDGSQTPVVGTTGASPSGTTGDPVAADVEPESGLYRVDPATGEAKLFFSAAGELREPERSPEGSAIVYQSSGGRGIPQIFMLEGRGGSQADPPAGRGGGADVVAGRIADRICGCGERGRRHGHLRDGARWQRRPPARSNEPT